MNRQLTPKHIFQCRSQLKNTIRNFFQRQEYEEVDTPIVVPCPGTEIHLNYFSTQWQDYKGSSHRLWLRSSPELHMKQVLAMGLDKIFQLAPSFRNHGELGKWHSPEFLMLEWYEVGITFADLIQQTIELLRKTQMEFYTVFPIYKGGVKLPRDFPTFSIQEAFSKFASLDLIDQDPHLARKAKAAGVISVNADDGFETAFFKILLEKIEPAIKLLEAAVLYDYPPSQAALAKIENGVAKRFEIYIQGVELCNGFWEQLDAAENRSRIAASNCLRRQQEREVCLEDEYFYQALSQGIPSACGNALGFDRWLALLMNCDSLSCTNPFFGQKPFSQDNFLGS